MQVLIPIDLPAPYQVTHEGLTVVVGVDRLVVHPSEATFPRLAAALDIAQRAINHLPRTPFVAAGINVRYKSGGPIPALQEIVANSWDDRLSDQRLEIKTRTVTRAVRRQTGQINVTVSEEENQAFSLGLNFDLQSDDPAQLLAWITISGEEMRREVEQILYNSIGLPPEEVEHG